MRALQQAIDWAHREEPPGIYIASFPRKTQKALQLLVAEIHRLGNECDRYKAALERILEHLQLPCDKRDDGVLEQIAAEAVRP